MYRKMCSKTLENGVNGCPYDEKEKDELILNRFYAQIFERVSV